MTTPSHQHKRGGARVAFPPPLVFVLLLVVGALLQYFVHALWVPIPSPWRYLVAAVFGVPGFVLGLQAQLLFKRSGQHPAPWMPSPELVLQGPYRFTRNPMYLGMTLVTIGIGLAADNVWMIGAAFVSLVVVHLIAVVPEEAHLGEKFGDSYARYKAQVRRYL